MIAFLAVPALTGSVNGITMQDVLQFDATFRRRDQWRGPCPVHGSRSPGSRSFTVYVRLEQNRCFRRGSHGKALELRAVMHHFSVYSAAVDLCQQLGLEILRVRRW